MEIGKTFYTSERSEWRAWLANNFASADEIWFLFPKKASGIPSLLYNDAVEEALCFGWIDSLIKTLDDDYRAQRFTPRKPKSNFSQTNIERFRWLLANNLIHPSLIESTQELLAQEFVFPPDIIRAIQANEIAWKNFQSFSPAYQRIRVAYIETRRNKPEEFNNRLNNFIEKCEKNIQVGYGGIDKYF